MPPDHHFRTTRQKRQKPHTEKRGTTGPVINWFCFSNYKRALWSPAAAAGAGHAGLKHFPKLSGGHGGTGAQQGVDWNHATMKNLRSPVEQKTRAFLMGCCPSSTGLGAWVGALDDLDILIYFTFFKGLDYATKVFASH